MSQEQFQAIMPIICASLPPKRRVFSDVLVFFVGKRTYYLRLVQYIDPTSKHTAK